MSDVETLDFVNTYVRQRKSGKIKEGHPQFDLYGNVAEEDCSKDNLYRKATYRDFHDNPAESIDRKTTASPTLVNDKAKKRSRSRKKQYHTNDNTDPNVNPPSIPPDIAVTARYSSSANVPLVVIGPDKGTEHTVDVHRTEAWEKNASVSHTSEKDVGRKKCRTKKRSDRSYSQYTTDEPTAPKTTASPTFVNDKAKKRSRSRKKQYHTNDNTDPNVNPPSIPPDIAVTARYSSSANVPLVVIGPDKGTEHTVDVHRTEAWEKNASVSHTSEKDVGRKKCRSKKRSDRSYSQYTTDEPTAPEKSVSLTTGKDIDTDKPFKVKDGITMHMQQHVRPTSGEDESKKGTYSKKSADISDKAYKDDDDGVTVLTNTHESQASGKDSVKRNSGDNFDKPYKNNDYNNIPTVPTKASGIPASDKKRSHSRNVTEQSDDSYNADDDTDSAGPSETPISPKLDKDKAKKRSRTKKSSLCLDKQDNTDSIVPNVNHYSKNIGDHDKPKTEPDFERKQPTAAGEACSPLQTHKNRKRRRDQRGDDKYSRHSSDARTTSSGRNRTSDTKTSESHPRQLCITFTKSAPNHKLERDVSDMIKPKVIVPAKKETKNIGNGDDDFSDIEEIVLEDIKPQETKQKINAEEPKRKKETKKIKRKNIVPEKKETSNSRICDEDFGDIEEIVLDEVRPEETKPKPIAPEIKTTKKEIKMNKPKVRVTENTEITNSLICDDDFSDIEEIILDKVTPEKTKQERIGPESKKNKTKSSVPEKTETTNSCICDEDFKEVVLKEVKPRLSVQCSNRNKGLTTCSISDCEIEEIKLDDMPCCKRCSDTSIKTGSDVEIIILEEEKTGKKKSKANKRVAFCKELKRKNPSHDSIVFDSLYSQESSSDESESFDEYTEEEECDSMEEPQDNVTSRKKKSVLASLKDKMSKPRKLFSSIRERYRDGTLLRSFRLRLNRHVRRLRAFIRGRFYLYTCSCSCKGTSFD